MRRLALALVLVAGCAPSIVPPTVEDAAWARSQWPESTLEELTRGYAVYRARCAGCHSLYRPEARPPERWSAIVDTMATRARLGPEDAARILRFLETRAVVAAERRPHL